MCIHLQQTTDDKSLQACVFEACDALLNAGYTKPISTLTQADKAEVVKTLKLHFTLLNSLAETNQLKQGFQANGVGKAMAKYSDLMKPLFVSGSRSALTAGKCKDMVHVLIGAI